jgi:hypothetical protein
VRKSVIRNDLPAEVSVGVHFGFWTRYEPGSLCRSPIKTSPTMRPPTGPRCSPFAVSGYWFNISDPANLVNGLFDSPIRAANNEDFSYFHNAAFDRQAKAAAKLSGPKRYRAYARLALELERDYAPVAAIAVDASRDFFSARIGCQIYQPVSGMDLAALCLRE